MPPIDKTQAQAEATAAVPASEAPRAAPATAGTPPVGSGPAGSRTPPDASPVPPTRAELLIRIAQADKLLAGPLPPGHRLKVAKLRFLAQLGIMLREKAPALDRQTESTAARSNSEPPS